MQDGRAWEAVGRLEIGGTAFCTGALIEPGLVLTAAHCLFDAETGKRVPIDQMQFLAGWRNGRAAAYRYVRQAVPHPEYKYSSAPNSERVRNDVALLRLQHPIRNTTIVPFETDMHPVAGDKLGVVSYAHDRSEAPSLQETCEVIARQEGVIIMSCEVDFGSSGSPVFSFASGEPHIVSVVSGKAKASGRNVSLGTSLMEPLAVLRAELGGIRRFKQVASSGGSGGVADRQTTGAKFIRP